MKSCFVKYKEYVRKYRKIYDEVKANPQREFLMKEFVKYIKENNLTEEDYENDTFLQKHLIDAFKQALNDNPNLLTKIASVNQAKISINQSLINAFDNEKAINFPDIELLINILTATINDNWLTEMETFKILGSAFKFGNTHPKKVTDELMKEIVSLLSSYFDIYGNFIYVEDYTNFANGVNKLLTYIKELIQFEQKEALCEKIDSEELLRNLANAYLVFHNSYIIVPDKNIAIELQKKGYSPELKRYYRNGNLIEIPQDLASFINLLKENDIPIAEQRHILSLIEKKTQEKHAAGLQGFYLTDEREIVLAGNKFLDNTKSYQEMYYEVKGVLEDIQTLEKMYFESTTVEEKDYVLREKEALIAQLRHLLLPKYEQEESTNIIFLKDINNESYFENDLSKIDNSIQKRAISLLAKINVANKRNFRKVYMNEPGEENIYEVVNSYIHIIFTELPRNRYLIIGASPVGNNYREITNRLLNKYNQKVIAEISSHISKNEYLAQTENADSKRIRKK